MPEIYGYNACAAVECTVSGDDCSNIIQFANLLNLPASFASNWQNLRISVKPYLQCVLEPCIVNNAQLVFTDPCRQTHHLQKYVAPVKRARILGSIEYILSAQSADSDVPGEPASVSGFYSIPVNRSVSFIDDRDITQCSIIVNVQDLRFDDPPVYAYGQSEALRITGEFVLNLGFIRNGSFENGFLGWQQDVPPGATAETVMEFEDYVPIKGCYFALLKTDGPGSYNSIQQSFYANAGDSISGWAFFLTKDYMPYDDNSNIQILSGDTVLSTPFSASVSSVGDYGSTPWTHWEYTFPTTGIYTVRAEIANAVDSNYPSYVGLDAIQLISPH
jgi:hypothetical protein